jgi:CRISPR-associated protein Cas2
MLSLIIYDIPSDKLRNKVADICQDYGLKRIQFSAFMGEINHNRREELLQRLKREIGKKQSNVQLFPICDKDMKLRQIISVSEKIEGNDKSDGQ